MNIPWDRLSGTQIREVIRSWPVLPEFLTQGSRAAMPTQLPKNNEKPPKINTPKVTAPKVTAPKVTAPKVKDTKSSANDGDVQFLAHRNIWVGFWGGKRVVKRSTEQACREALEAQFGKPQRG